LGKNHGARGAMRARAPPRLQTHLLLLGCHCYTIICDAEAAGLAARAVTPEAVLSERAMVLFLLEGEGKERRML